jgi:hypothetical protein
MKQFAPVSCSSEAALKLANARRGWLWICKKTAFNGKPSLNNPQTVRVSKNASRQVRLATQILAVELSPKSDEATGANRGNRRTGGEVNFRALPAVQKPV